MIVEFKIKDESRTAWLLMRAFDKLADPIDYLAVITATFDKDTDTLTFEVDLGPKLGKVAKPLVDEE